MAARHPPSGSRSKGAMTAGSGCVGYRARTARGAASARATAAASTRPGSIRCCPVSPPPREPCCSGAGLGSLRLHVVERRAQLVFHRRAHHGPEPCGPFPCHKVLRPCRPDQRLGDDDALTIEGDGRAFMQFVAQADHFAHTLAERGIVLSGQDSVDGQSVRWCAHEEKNPRRTRPPSPRATIPDATRSQGRPSASGSTDRGTRDTMDGPASAAGTVLVDADLAAREGVPSPGAARENGVVRRRLRESSRGAPA